MSDNLSLVETNIYFLRQGIDLLNDLNDDIYKKSNPSIYNSSAGKHLRHVIDHYLSLVYHADNCIDYDDRERDEKIEMDKTYSISVMQEIIERLEEYIENSSLLNKKVRIRSNEGAEISNEIWSESSIKRELQFLLSHTIHHYALIAIILRTQGYNPDREFGVAPSTLHYQKQQVSSTVG